MSIASTLKCWQHARDEMNGRSGANIVSRMLSEDGKEVEFKLLECPKMGDIEADTCVKMEGKKRTAKFCANFNIMNKGLIFQIS